MRSLIYVIVDSVSGQTSPLFLEPNEDSALRQFKAFLRNSQNSPDDYVLYCVGVFNHDTVIIESDSGSHLVARGANIRWSIPEMPHNEEVSHGE